ncbi:hypothetical protein [Delftia acidovorans]|uniref:hypothetical protein n=1 Tax=Delftia acidovorans TaxID=80866 RepID=UPI0030187C95
MYCRTAGGRSARAGQGDLNMAMRLLNQEGQNAVEKEEIVCMLNETGFLINFLNEERFVSVDNV